MPRVFVEATTIGDLVDRAAATSDGDAIVFPDERVTFPELAALSDRFARSLRGLGRGPRRQGRDPDAEPARLRGGFVGAAKLGAIPVPINGRFKEHELSHVIAHADITVLLCASGPEDTVDYPELLARRLPRRGAARSPGRFESSRRRCCARSCI